ncbi:uncharacterized protein LOC132876470 isoform X2 [Neoarius graeffei]|uniref:uncharacterized protein LOC132876470 isoform X2 n=1 Tax=Neoarius graeffei TaxID=443677 RepID=UPI00298C1F5B|nr:uncharacterized protein LOC132876470 isoform X2 [Neoarius graeffei]
MSDSTTVRVHPALPPERVLCSGTVIFPGVFDQLGSLLVIFPAEFQDKLLHDVTKEEVAEFVFYCLRLHNPSRSECLVSVVADLREASLAVTRRVAEILLLLQLHQRTVSSFYTLQPKKRDIQKLLQKLLTPPKRSTTPMPVKCVFLREVFELCNYVDRSQLTPDLGGYFIYSHESWVSFIREMESFVQEFVAVVRKLPVCIGALQDFSKLSVPTEYNALAVFCWTNQTRLEHLRRDLGLDALLRRCECVLEKFRYPERDQCYQAMVGTVLFTHTALEMLQNYDRIQAAVKKVELLWRRVFSNAHLQLRALQLQRDAQQVVCEMEHVMQKLQTYTPGTLRDSNRAETLRLEFDTSVCTHATTLVHRAEDLLNTVSETVAFTQRRKGHEWINELERLKDQLRAAVEFQKRNLNTICTFHQCHHKIQRWYHVAVCESFLQDLLWRTCSNKPDHKESLPHEQSGVFSVIEEFLRLHPPPEVEELMQLAHLANTIHDAHLENAGKQLAQRCTSLRKLLVSPGSVAFCDLQQALQWQYECLKGRNETAGLTSDLHPQGNACAQSVLRDSDFCSCSVSGNGLLRRGANDPPLLQSGAKPLSLSSFDSGFDGAGSGNFETGGGKVCQDESSRLKSPHLHASEETVSRISEDLAEEKPLGEQSISIIPNATGDSNFKITVKRSATLPKNPWLSLPLDDLENCYTVIISPSQQREIRSCDQLTQTSDASVCEFEDQSNEWSSIHNILSSTVADGGHEAETSAENMPTLLWDSYDLHDLLPDSDGTLLSEPACEWEIKEQQELQAVEETLSRAAEILQEEENVLAQEEIVDVLLEADNPDRLWPSWTTDCQFTLTSSDLAEAGVIGLEDDLASLHFGSDLSLGTPRVMSSSDGVSQPGSDPLHLETGPDRLELLKPLEGLKVLEEKIVEENLKINELHHCESEERMSPQSLTEDRKRFREKLEQEKKEVEEMERNLSREMKKSKLKCPSRSCKIVTCSIMGKESVLMDDEALLMNCRTSVRDAQVLSGGQPCLEEPTSRQPSDMDAVDNPVHLKCSDPEASIDFKCSNVATDSLTNKCLNSQRNIDLTASSISDTATVMDDGVGGCDFETKMLNLVSSVTNLSNAQGLAIGEPKPLSDSLDTSDKWMQLDPLETLNATEQCNEDPKEEASEGVLTPAFDPGGPTSSLPQKSRLDEQRSMDSGECASVGPKPEEHKNPPCRTSPIDLQHQNTNNNNLHTVDLHVGLESVPEGPRSSECIDRAEDQKPELWCDGQISRSPSPLLETSDPCGTVENKEGEIQVHHDGLLMRRVCRSPVLQQLQICTREMGDFSTPVVLDTGSSLVKAGFADQDLPTTIFPTAIGLPKYEEVMSGSVERGVYVGHDAQHMRGVLTLHHPMKNGVVSNWDHMEMIWSHAFEQLRVCSEDHPVLLTEGAVSAHKTRQRSIQLMFESFNVPLAYTAMQPVLALYTTGHTTGLVFDSGDGASHSVPVFEGYCLPHAVQCFNLAGADVTLHLKQKTRLRTTP